MADVVWQLIELTHAPVGQARPAASPNAAGVVVELLSIAHEEVDEQKQHEEGGDEQIADCHAPACPAGSCQARAGISMLSSCHWTTSQVQMGDVLLDTNPFAYTDKPQRLVTIQAF